MLPPCPSFAGSGSATCISLYIEFLSFFKSGPQLSNNNNKLPTTVVLLELRCGVTAAFCVVLDFGFIRVGSH